MNETKIYDDNYKKLNYVIAITGGFLFAHFTKNNLLSKIIYPAIFLFIAEYIHGRIENYNLLREDEINKLKNYTFL